MLAACRETISPVVAKSDQRTVVTVQGRPLTLTNLDKVLYPETGTTKRDVLEYYATVGEWLIPHVADRPATRKRWVHGVGTAAHPGAAFFQKNLDSASTPSWVARRSIEHSDHSNEYPLVNDLATLTWLGQVAALEIHVPQWRFGSGGARQNPDRLVLDLDPGEGVGLLECVEVASLAREILRGVGLEPVPVTSGSKGIHLYCGLDGRRTSQQISDFAHELARSLEADHPDLVVSDMKKIVRRGRVLVDWSQNNGNKTTIAPYSLRGRARPTVAAPRTWREIASTGLRQLEYPEVLARLGRRGDPLVALTAESPPRSDLREYRAKRDADRTPEPFGDGGHPAVGRSAEPIFVIQEHRARRLHWDFRLEHHGVLVSWALPKGVPESTGANHLAVHVENHPMDYARFEGEIPAGEYGAGHVEIWDEGTYSVEKWREGREVVVVLHGRRDDRRYALIHTREDQWLIHLTREQPTDAARSTSAETYSPELATLGSPEDIPVAERAAWAYEMKWDGVRALATVRGGRVRLRSRTGNDLTATFPELAELADAVDRDAVLDGEIVALDSAGRPDFGRLQRRLGLTSAAEVARARRSVPVALFLFDILERDSADLTGEPYDVRRAILLTVVPGRGAIQVPADAGDDLDDALASSLELGLEGVMAKRRASPYRIGRRSRDWLKLKHLLTQEVLIVGWRPGAGRRSGTVGSLLMSVPGPDGLRYVGRVGTGFRDRDLDEMRMRFDEMSLPHAPLPGVPAADARNVHWIRPELVGEVSYAERTRDGRLRQPSWRGWRADKHPDQVADESPPGPFPA